jgi:predicted ester cyclase
MQFELHTTIAEADKVVCIGIMRGLHDGPVHGLPPDLQTHRDTRHPVLTFNHDGLITDHLAARDDLTLLRQLGALPHNFPWEQPAHLAEV